MNANLTVIFLFLAAVIGIFIGLLLSSIFSNKDNQQKKHAPPEILREGFGEVGRLWYSPAARTVLTEMDGGYYKKFGDLSQDQKEKVLKLISLWQAWSVEKPHEAAVPPVFYPVSEPAAKPALEERIEAVSPFTQPAGDEDVISVLQQSLETEEEEALAAAPVEPSGQLSITEQISLILQELLEGTELKEKGVTLIENQQNGVDVWVGMEKYSGVEDVPYPQIRQLIHEAVMRWENETDVQQRMGG